MRRLRNTLRCAPGPTIKATNRALREFKAESRADAWLCAEALASGLTLVTYETVSNSVKKVKIPNVCAGMGIRCIGGFDFMRAQGFRF